MMCGPTWNSLPPLIPCDLLGHPFTNKHVRDSDAPHVGRATCETVLDDLQKNLIKAAGLIVRIPRNGREASPFTRSSPKEPVFTSMRRRPIEQCRVLGDEGRTSAQRVGDL